MSHITEKICIGFHYWDQENGVYIILIIHVEVCNMYYTTDISILKDFTSGCTDGSKLGRLVTQHNAMLRFALKCKSSHNLYFIPPEANKTDCSQISVALHSYSKTRVYGILPYPPSDLSYITEEAYIDFYY